MFFWKRTSIALAKEVEWLRRQLEKSQERIDRLTEAVARKEGTPIYMPQAELPKFVSNAPEKSPGWWDQKPAQIIPPIGGK